MKYVGQWNNGQIAQGSWKYPNGSEYKGAFDNNKPKGKGQWQF
jgi:hypothetical protein